MKRGKLDHKNLTTLQLDVCSRFISNDINSESLNLISMSSQLKKTNLPRPYIYSTISVLLCWTNQGYECPLSRFDDDSRAPWAMLPCELKTIHALFVTQVETFTDSPAQTCNLTLKDASRVLTPEHLAGDANAGSHPLLVAGYWPKRE